MKTSLIVPGQQEIVLPKKTVGVGVSGGVDSALLLYLIFEQTNLPIHLFSVVSRWLGSCEIERIAQIVDFMNQRFPHRELTHTVKYADSADHMKSLLFVEPQKALYRSQIIGCYLTGLTLSPTEQDQQEFFPYVLTGDDAQERSPETVHPIKLGPNWYCPLRNLNKKQLAKIYNDLGILDLFDLTRSCTETQQHCGECWWCHERKWAFGRL